MYSQKQSKGKKYLLHQDSYLPPMKLCSDTRIIVMGSKNFRCLSVTFVYYLIPWSHGTINTTILTRELFLKLKTTTLSTFGIPTGSLRGDCITSRASSRTRATNPSQFSNLLTVTGYQLTETCNCLQPAHEHPHNTIWHPPSSRLRPEFQDSGYINAAASLLWNSEAFLFFWCHDHSLKFEFLTLLKKKQFYPMFDVAWKSRSKGYDDEQISYKDIIGPL